MEQKQLIRALSNMRLAAENIRLSGAENMANLLGIMQTLDGLINTLRKEDEENGR